MTGVKKMAKGKKLALKITRQAEQKLTIVFFPR